MTGGMRFNREVDMPTSSGTARGNPSYSYLAIKISYKKPLAVSRQRSAISKEALVTPDIFWVFLIGLISH